MMDEKDRFAELESPESLLYRDLGDFNFLTKRMPSVSFLHGRKFAILCKMGVLRNILNFLPFRKRLPQNWRLTLLKP